MWSLLPDRLVSERYQPLNDGIKSSAVMFQSYFKVKVTVRGLSETVH